MLTSAPTHACTPGSSSSSRLRPSSSNGPSTSSDSPPAASASTVGEMIAARGRGAVRGGVPACAVTEQQKVAEK